MNTIDIQFDDKQLAEIMARLKKLSKQPDLRPAMNRVVFMVHNDIATYPPATAANRPGRTKQLGDKTISLGHYVRGEGWVTAGGKHLGNSETLGRRWTTEVNADGSRGVVGNNASYVQYVHNQDKQAGFHKDRGWPTAQEVVEERRQEIREILMAPIKGIINGTK